MFPTRRTGGGTRTRAGLARRRPQGPDVPGPFRFASPRSNRQPVVGARFMYTPQAQRGIGGGGRVRPASPAFSIIDFFCETTRLPHFLRRPLSP